MKKEIKYLIIILAILIALFIANSTYKNYDISNFRECVNAGNPVMESYPRQCIANGETFVEEIKNYYSTDLDKCSRSNLLCVEETIYFSDKTGCGCEKVLS